MNPDTNKFEQLAHFQNDGPLNRKQRRALERDMREAKGFERAYLQEQLAAATAIVRPDGSPVPDHWPVFSADETVVIKGYTFKVAHIGESHMLLEPVGPLVIPGANDP